MSNKKTKLLYIGNKLSKHGKTKTGIETLGPQLESEGYLVFYAGSYNNMFLRFCEMTLKLVCKAKTLDYVLIDTYSSKAFWYSWTSSLICKVLNIKYITILRGGDLPKRLRSSKILCDHIFNNSYKNVAVSNYLKYHFESTGYSIHLIPNNININEYNFKIREELKPKVLWVRSFHRIYNPRMAADVLWLLLKNYADAELCMVGPDKDGSMEDFIDYCKELGIYENVKITGLLSKQEWHNLASKYDIFINTTNVDNTPVSVIEAMALGLPVVSTNVGGLPYLLEHGVDAILVEKENTQQMYNSILELIDNDSLSKIIIQNGRSKAETFNWDIVKKLWEELLFN